MDDKLVKEKRLFENSPVLKAILTLAIPSVLGQLILVIYNLADTIFIGLAADQAYFIDNGLRKALIAGVTICLPIYMLLTAISNLFGIGAASVMSRSMARNNMFRTKNAFRFAFYACLGTSLVYCLIMFFVRDGIAIFLNGGGADADPNAVSYASNYILYCIVIFGIPTTLNTLFSHLLRAQGKSLHASIGIMLGGVLNVALDPLFIFVFFDIKDAAIAAALATGISNTIALLYYIVLFAFRKKRFICSFKFKLKMFKEEIPKEVFIVGLPACLMTLCENVSNMILDNLIGGVLAGAEGTAALAGIGVAKKVNMFAHSIVRGMTQGVLPLIGYNKSSGNRKRMKRIVYVSGAISLAIASLSMIISLTLARSLSECFTRDDRALYYAEIFLRILCIGAPFSAIGYTVISFFQAVGKPWRSLLLALMRKGILDIPLMYIFYVVSLNLANVELIVWATPIADVICCLTALVLFFIYIKRNGQNKVPKMVNDWPNDKKVTPEDSQIPNPGVFSFVKSKCNLFKTT